MFTLVSFIDKEEKVLHGSTHYHFGILTGDKTIICFCCGGLLEEGDYEIIERDIPWCHLDEITKEYL